MTSISALFSNVSFSGVTKSHSGGSVGSVIDVSWLVGDVIPQVSFFLFLEENDKGFDDPLSRPFMTATQFLCLFLFYCLSCHTPRNHLSTLTPDEKGKTK